MEHKRKLIFSLLIVVLLLSSFAAGIIPAIEISEKIENNVSTIENVNYKVTSYNQNVEFDEAFLNPFSVKLEDIITSDNFIDQDSYIPNNKLDETAFVCGYVDDLDTGLPLENAYVDLNWQDNQGGWDWNNTMTDVTGYYSFNVAPGEITLNFNKDGYFGEYFDWMPIGDGETLWMNVSLLIKPPQLSIVTGFVTDFTTGLPIENVWVNINWYDEFGHYDWNSSSTNETGFYSMGIQAGTFDLSFSADGYYYEWIGGLTISDYDILQYDMSLYPEADENSVVCGYVDDFDTGLPIENVWVNIDWNDGFGHNKWNSTQTDATGFYSMYVSEGFFDLSYSHEDFHYTRTEGHVIGGYEIYWANITLIPKPDENSYVVGYVDDFDTGLPMPYANIELYWTDNMGNYQSNSTQANDTGFYWINVAAGSCFVRAYTNDYAYEVSDMFDVDEHMIYWENFSLIIDSALPVFLNILIPDSVGYNNPGDISVDIYDETLYQVAMFIVDMENITYDQNSIMIYLIDYSGESKTYELSDYEGYYPTVDQDRQSTKTTMAIFTDWTETDLAYVICNWKKNESTDWSILLLEYDIPTGLLQGVKVPSSLPYMGVEFLDISDMIEPGVSIFRAQVLPPFGDWVEDPTYNFTLYEIGNSNNPTFNLHYLNDGEYGGMVMAQDRADQTNMTMFNITVFHDFEAPDIVDNSPTEAEAGEPFTFNVMVTDNVEVSEVYVEYWYDTGSHINITMDYVSGAYWEETIIVDSASEILHYFIAAVDATSNWASTDITDVPITGNNPPEAPTIEGEASGTAEETYEYSFLAEDPDDDDIYYIIEWGDGTDTEIGPVPSGTEISASHSWEKGDYTLRAKAKDIYDAESDWTTLEISMPRAKFNIQSFIFQFFDRFPNMFPILRYILL